MKGVVEKEGNVILMKLFNFSDFCICIDQVSTMKFDLRLWQSFTELEYLLIGLVSAVPAFLLPMLFVGKVTTSTLQSSV